MEGAKSNPPNELLTYLVCKEFGWNYQEVMEAPEFFIDTMILISGIKNKYDNKRFHHG